MEKISICSIFVIIIMFIFILFSTPSVNAAVEIKEEIYSKSIKVYSSDSDFNGIELTALITVDDFSTLNIENR